MGTMQTSLTYLLASWGAVTAVLVALIVYGNALSTREDDELYLNSAEQVMMASEQKVMIGKMHSLLEIIFGVSIVSCVLFVASAGVWAWIGFHS